MQNCKNCDESLMGEYCAHCGQVAKLERIDGKYIKNEIVHLLHLEKGLFYTVKELLLNPGKTVQQYLLENRSRLVKPIVFIVVCSLVYSIANHYFHIEDGYATYQDSKPSYTLSIFEWIQSHYGYANIIMGVFIAGWIKILFQKHDYNFYEVLILLCFIMGIGMLILALFSLVQGIAHIEVMQIAGIIFVLYASWAIGQFFTANKIMNYVKAFFAYLLGMLSFSLVAVGLGFLLDKLIAH